MALKVFEPSQEVLAMGRGWAMAEALLAGTQAMRDASRTYLPQETREDEADYNLRLSVATLFPAFRRTVSVMAAKPFSKPITLGEDVPARLVNWLDNCDTRSGNGRNLHTFASEVSREALSFGICGVLVEHPKRDQSQPNTIEIDQKLSYRPYLVFIRHRQILGWIAEVTEGTVHLLQLRLAETANVPDGDFGTKVVNRVRVLRPGSFEVWEEGASGEYALLEGGTSSVNEITFVPFYGRQTGFMTGVTPLVDVAFLNVKHWQQQSDQDDSARFARKRLLVFSGMTETSPVVSGSGYAINLPLGATATVVQGSAESVTVGRSELEALEDQMIQAGAELLVQKPGAARTATESNNDAEANKCELQVFAEGIEDSIDRVLQYMALYVGEQQGGHVKLFADYGAASLTDASAQLILNMQSAGLISKPTAIREQQRRGMLAPDIEPEEELDKVKEEGPAPGTLTDDDVLPRKEPADADA